MNNLAAQLKLLARPLPLWLPIALTGAQSLIEVQLEDEQGKSDVTDNQVVVSLAPFMVGIGGATARSAQLRFFDRVTGRQLGRLSLTGAGTLPAADGTLGLFRISGSSQVCVAAPLRAWNRLLQARAQRRHTSADNFRMSPAAIQQMLIFYLCPRPVALVSVDDGTSSNMFPMDLIGPVAGGFTLALRNSSASVATLRKAGRAALADVPATDRDLAYGLGKHHHQSTIDWSTLPFPLTRSPRFELPVPAQAARVRECEIDSAHEIGSHTLFRCRVVTDESRSEVPRLFHTSGIHGHFRARQTHAMPWFEAGNSRCT